MVVKIAKAQGAVGMIKYNLSKVANQEGKVIGSNLIFDKKGEWNERDIIQQFEKRADINQRTKKPYIHISLNPNPKDKLSNEELHDIAQDFMGKMGYGNQPYLVVKHNDIEREHIHIIACNIDLSGKKIKDSHDYQRAQKAIQELQAIYNLTPIAAKKQQNEINHTDSKEEVSEQIRKVLGRIEDYKYSSFNEFRALCEIKEIDAQYIKRANKNTDIFTGCVFALMQNGKKIKHPIKGSALGFSLQDVEKRYKHKPSDKSLRTIKSKIVAAKKMAENENDFINNLRKLGIDAIIRQNEQGRIYGITYIDKSEKWVLNGSKIGKEFSANAIDQLFHSTDIAPLEPLKDDSLDILQIFDVNLAGIAASNNQTAKKKKKKDRNERKYPKY